MRVDKKNLFLPSDADIVTVVLNHKFLSLFFLFSTLTGWAKLTPLGEQPDWSKLDSFQSSITRSEFETALKKVYCPRQEWWQPWIMLQQNFAAVRISRTEDEWYRIHFLAREDEDTSLAQTTARPSLKGLVIGLDPGHIGGEWSEMERRHFHVGTDRPVKEGDLSLCVARRLSEQLVKLGAVPVLVRKDYSPVTPARPSYFLSQADAWAAGILGGDSNRSTEYIKLVKDRSELLFYRVDEIRARADLINHSIQPDLVICLHFNAAPWPDPENRTLVERNDFHVLVNGCYMGGELAYDDQRFEMLFRLLSGWHKEERNLAEAMAVAFDQTTGLPAFSYKGPNALKLGDVEGVWARNLLANRKYHAPVVFLEPYVANSQSAYQRIQRYLSGGGGDPDCLVEEYVDAVLRGLQIYCQ